VTVARQAVRSAVYNTLASYISQALGFASSLILLRLLDPVHYGAFGAAMIVVSIFGRLRMWGFNQLLVAETDPDDLQISTQFWLSVFFSLVVVAAILVAQPALRLVYSAQQVFFMNLIALVAILESDGVASTPETILRRELRYDYLSIMQIVSIAASLGITILIAAGENKDWALFGGYASKTLIYCVGIWFLAPRKPCFLFSIERARGLMDQGKKLLWGGLGSYLAFQYDDFAVSVFSGEVALGLYRKAYDWSLIPMSVINGILGVSAATYARFKQDRAALSQAVSSMLEVVAMFSIPSSVGLVVVADQFILTLFPAKWLPAAPLLRLLVVYSLLRPLRESFSGLAAVLDRIVVMRTIGIAQTITMLVSGTVLTLLWDAHGAAVSAGLTAFVAMYILYRGVLRGNVDVNYVRILFPPVVATATAAAVTMLISGQYLPEQPWLALLFKIGIFAGTYLAVLILTARRRILHIAQVLVRSFLGERPAAASPPS
jgi:O-antigen/teichoic acid export membrane protein